MSATKSTPNNLGLEYSVAKAIAIDGESIRRQVTEMLNNLPQYLANELEPFELGCSDEKLADFLLSFSKQVCTHMAQLEFELEAQKGKAEHFKRTTLALSEMGRADLKFTVIAIDTDFDGKYLMERVKDLMTVPISDWHHFGGYIAELTEDISRTICSV